MRVLLLCVWLGLAGMLVAQDFGEINARYNRGMIEAIQRGEMNRAASLGEEWLEALERARPSKGLRARIYLLLGTAYQGANNYRDADDRLSEAVSLIEAIDRPTTDDQRVAFAARLKLIDINLERAPNEALGYLEDNDTALETLEPFDQSYLNDYYWARYWFNKNDFREADRRMRDFRAHYNELRRVSFNLFILAKSLDALIQTALGNDEKSIGITENLVRQVEGASNNEMARALPVYVEVVRLLAMHERHEKAVELTRSALGAIDRGMEVPRWVVALLKENLAVSLNKLGQVDEATRVLKEAVAQSSPQDSPSGYANMVTTLANLLSQKGTPAVAIPYLMRAREVLIGMRNPEPNTLYRVTGALSMTCYANGDVRGAVKYGLESIAAGDDALSSVSGRTAFSDAHGTMTFLKRFSAADILIDSGDAPAIASLLLRRKGRMFSEAFPKITSSNRRRQQDLWQAREDLFFAVESAGQSRESGDREKKLRKARDLAARIVDLEGQESSRRPATNVTPSEIAQKLAPGTVAIEFISYPKLTRNDGTEAVKKGRGPEQLGAIIYLERQAPQWVKLGALSDIEALMKAWDKAIGKGLLREKELTDALRGLHTAIWRPLAAVLPASVDKVIVCTDAPVHFLPFEALEDEDGKFLLERYAFRRVQNLADAVARSAPRLTKSDRVLVTSQQKFASSTDPALQKLALADLNGAASEVASIAAIIPGSRVQVLSDEVATEREFRRKVPSCEILHLVTHSLYFPSIQKSDAWDEFKDNLSANVVRDLLGFTLLLEGSGASIEEWKNGRATRSSEDGLLNLEDVGRLDLSRMKLAVLCACETQLAPAYAGEGLLGFERALHAAGVGNVVLSLWRVPDVHSAIFIDRFYRQLEATQNVQTAYTEAQRETFGQLRAESLKDAIRAVGCFIYSANYLRE